MTREELFQWVKQEYGTEAEYPWKDSNAVLRRADNDKWYGVILSVAGSKLGLEDDNIIDVINLKSDPMLIGSLRFLSSRERMNRHVSLLRGHWFWQSRQERHIRIC